MLSFTVLFSIALALATGTNITINGRIIGGQNVDIAYRPYMVSLHSHDNPTCGGSIISPDTILTAAHCIHKGKASQYSVHSGSNSADKGTVHQVYQIIEHPYYDSVTQSYDVAKLKITPPITYSTNCQPIKLCRRRAADNTILVINGWGRQKEGVKATVTERQNLRAIYVRAVNQDECARKYQNQKINSVMMCAEAAGKDVCRGDSGGPLVNTKTGEQCGIASWGIGCANPLYPGVYTSVPEVLNFIES